MNFFTAVGSCFLKYVTFTGRASRAEYWWWTLFLFLGSFVYSLVLAFWLDVPKPINLEATSTDNLLDMSPGILILNSSTPGSR